MIERQETELFSLISAAAEKLYDPQLPYHNFAHAQSVLAQAERMINNCQSEGVPIDVDVVRYAALFHDAGHNADIRALGFDTKEAYAASLAGETLERFGIATEVIERVQATIMATHRDAAFTTNEQKAVRAADIANMAGTYAYFVDANSRLKAEREMLAGHAISWAEWKEGTKVTVEWYLRQDIRLTRHHEDEQGRSRFHVQVRANLERFLSDKNLDHQQ